MFLINEADPNSGVVQEGKDKVGLLDEPSQASCGWLGSDLIAVAKLRF